ncbi:PAS domain-containing protein [Dyadobacter psychrotolerans]|nr:PAS domain-containing protein [Dyadobacter psychrotolerans]
MFRLLPVAGLVIQPDQERFTIIQVNDAFFGFFDYKQENLVYEDFLNVFKENLILNSNDWKSLFLNIISERVAETTSVLKYKNKWNKDGYLSINLAPILNETEEVDLIMISFLNVSEPEPDQRFHTLIQTVEGIVWEADAQTLEFTFISGQVKSILGFSPDEWLSEKDFWQNHIHAQDREQAVRYCHFQLQDGKNHTFDYRMIHQNGRVVWIKDVVSIIYEGGQPKWLRGLMVDITETKRFSDLELLEKQILELNSQKDFPLEKVLYTYAEGIERVFSGMHCSILQIKDGRMHNWASPSLPKAYVEGIEGLVIGDYVGSCGSAAFLGERVIVNDIANHPKWTDYRELALSNNLHACWSHPIVNSEGGVIATFGIYYKEVKMPDEEELKIIDRSVAILKIILENRLNNDLIRETTLLMTQGQELAQFGNWQWDIASDVITWSDTLFAIYGLNKTAFKPSFERYKKLLHPDDRVNICLIIQNAIESKVDVEFEERIIRPSGELRYVKSWAKIIVNQEGEAIKLIGACLDITESKIIQEKLLASKARLRNLVDAQTNYVIRTDLEGNYTYYNNKYREDFGWFYADNNFLGTNCIDTVLPHHHSRVVEIGERCIERPNSVAPVEVDNVKEGGGIRSILWHFVCLTDSEGEPSEMQCIGIDISELKQAENDLRISNERYEYVNKATNDAIYDWDIVNDDIIWGEGFGRLFGWDNSKGKYPVKKWFARIHPSDLDKTRQSLLNTLDNSGERNWVMDYQFRKINGDYAYVEENSYVIRNEEGEAVRMIGVLRDVTRQKQEEHRLKLMESVVTDTNDSVLIAESDPFDKTKLKIIYVNEAFTKITGYSADEVMGKSPLILSGKNPDIKDFNRMLKAIRNRESLEFETIQYKKNGDYFWVSLSLSPVADEKGISTHWICIGHDVTERLNYIRAIEKQNKKFQEITWMQSHVVRAPLARLMGLVDLIKNYHNSDAERNELLDHILLSATEFDGIIRDISDKSSQLY